MVPSSSTVEQPAVNGKAVGSIPTLGAKFCPVGCQPICTVCGNLKKPVGRDGGLSWYGCDWECEGYRLEPTPCDLWPYERREERYATE